MKKIAAILLSCMMITVTFASCGKEKDSEEKSKREKSNPAIGKWVIDGNEDGLYLNIKSEDSAYFYSDQDFSGQMCFDSDGNLTFGGEELPKENYDFDGKELVIHVDTENDLTMEKTDRSNDGVYGEYLWTGGTAYDAIVSGYNSMAGDDEKVSKNDLRFLMECEENSTIFRLELAVDFEMDDDTISIDATEFFGDDYVFSGSYKIDDNKLTITGEEDNEVVLERAE